MNDHYIENTLFGATCFYSVSQFTVGPTGGVTGSAVYHDALWRNPTEESYPPENLYI